MKNQIFRTTSRHTELPEGVSLLSPAFLAPGKQFRPTRMTEKWKTTEVEGEIVHEFFEIALSGPVLRADGSPGKVIGRRWFESKDAMGFPQDAIPYLYTEGE